MYPSTIGWRGAGVKLRAARPAAIMNYRKAIPWALTALRAVLGPALVVIAMFWPAPEWWLGAMIAAGFVSDIYDGVLARRWKTVTPALRTADSATDLVFYLCVLAAAIARHWPVLRDRIWWVAGVLALEAVHIGFDWMKYGRVASYHAYSAKVWGVLLAAAAFTLLCFDRGFWILTLALAWGIVSEVEGIAMTALLPEWTHDVKTLRQAMILRRQMRAEPVLAGRL